MHARMRKSDAAPRRRRTRRAVLRLGLGGMAAGVLGGLWRWQQEEAQAALYAVTDHFDGRRFFNPWRAHKQHIASFLRWQWEGGRTPWPDSVADKAPPPLPASIPASQVALTFIGQATFLVQVNGLRLLTDPMFSLRAGPYGRFGPKRVRPPGHPLETLPPVPVVLLSHNHYDHCDLPTLHRLRERSDPLIVTGLGLGRYLKSEGFGRVVELDWWQATPLPYGARVTYVPAQHFSARGLMDRNRTLWGGFIIESGGPVLYFAGDSGYGPHFRTIAQRFPRIDVAMLPIGAYEPRWFMANAHVDPAEAVRAHLDLGARRSIAMHFGTFQLTNEGIDAPIQDLERARVAQGVAPEAFVVPGFGETLTIPV
jgi:L-ascorbate metabolism protein UlaG (beta-lactamase superfamily)